MISAELYRRLAALNDTEYFKQKGLEYFRKLVRAAEKAVSFSNLSTTYQNDVIEAEKELQ